MFSSNLTTMFSTLAQVSFTVSGLMAVAIAGDADRRNYWFGDKARSLFVYISFLLLLLPGFISVGGLIPSYSEKIPSWPYIAFFWGFLYLMLSITFFFRKKKAVRFDEFSRLEKEYAKVNTEMGSVGIVITILAIFNWGGYMISSQSTINQTETLLGITLWILTITSIIQSVDFLRSNEQASIQNNESNLTKSNEPSIHKADENKSVVIFIVGALVIAIIAFITGLIIDHKNN